MRKMKVLIAGSGGREHALAWKIAQSEWVDQIYIAPGNGGTQQVGINVPIKATDIPELLRFAQEKAIDLTVVGPEKPLAMGIVDVFKRHGLRIFGPTAKAAQIESSKAFAKKLMLQEGIPTAPFMVFSAYHPALNYALSSDEPFVIKVDGLADGKGVYICKNEQEKREALEKVMVKRVHGEAGDRVVIEKHLKGIEVSIHALFDGTTTVMFPASQDHKSLLEHGEGPNTGGMGCYSPVSRFTSDLMSNVKHLIIQTVFSALTKHEILFNACLYPGLMLVNGKPYVLEFNARFGDPEMQVYVRRLNSDLLELLDCCVAGNLEHAHAEWSNCYTACVVLCARGYPEDPDHNAYPIYGLKEAEEIEGVVISHAGTMFDGRVYRTAGGRILNITAVGETLEIALNRTYEGVDIITFEGKNFRKDIGKAS